MININIGDKLNVMSDESLNIVIGVATAIIGILAFVNEFPIRKIYKPIKSLAFKLITFVIATFVLIWATIKKDSNTELQTIREKLDAKKEQHKRDLDNRSLTNQSNAVIVKTFTEALAKYNLKLDSNQKIVLKTVKDSLNRKTTQIVEKTITTDALPDFDISQITFIKLRNDTIQFRIRFDCKKTAIKNLNLTLKMLILKQGLYTFIPQSTAFIQNDNFSSNTQQTADVTTICTLTNIYQAYFYIQGYYYYSGNKIPYENVFYYDFRSSTFGSPGNKDFLIGKFNDYL